MVDFGTGLVTIASALAVGICSLAAGIAEKDIGTAAMGAIAEKEELFGKALILTVIPETLVIFGLVMGLIIIGIA